MNYLEVLSNFTDESLEWKFSDKKFSGFLIASDFTQSDSAWPETMGLLHSSSSILSHKRLSYGMLYSKDGRTVAVFRAADFEASCLRGAFPIGKSFGAVSNNARDIFTSSGFARSLLGTSHCRIVVIA